MALSPEFIKEKIDYYDELPPLLREQLYERMLKVEGLTEEILEDILELTREGYLESTVDPGEAIGVVAAQSIGEPGTQMSIPGTEKVVIKQRDDIRILPIGEFVDSLINELKTRDDAKFSDDDEISMVVEIPPHLEYQVPALGPDEQVRWCRLLQVSRHPPNGPLLQIKTKSGRVITATFSHSFVVRENNEIVPKKGKDLKIGDFLPVVFYLQSPTPTLGFLPLDQYLPQAKESLHVTGTQAQHTSREFKLDFLTGWMIGAYLAKGNIREQHSIHISDVENEEYCNHIIEFTKQHDIEHRLIQNQHEEDGTLVFEVHVDSKILTTLLERACGKDLAERTIPGWTLSAPNQFIVGVLRAYFDAVGEFDSNLMMIRTFNRSKELIDRICLLLTRFGIFSLKGKEKDNYYLIIPSNYAEKFLEFIDTDNAKKKRELLKLVEKAKDKQQLHQENDELHHLEDVIPNFGNVLSTISNKLGIPPTSPIITNIKKITEKQVIERQHLKTLIQTLHQVATEHQVNITTELDLVEKAVNSHVFWDKIVSLEPIPSPSKFVYDFTVERHETFMTAESIITHNTLRTFHFAGVKERNVTLGLPRLIEILSASKNQSSPVMDVYLEPPYNQDQKLALEVQRAIEQTTIEGVAEDVSVDLAQSIIILRLKYELMEDKGVTLEMVQQALKKRLKLDPNAIEVDEDNLEVRVNVPPSERPDEIHEWSEKIKSVLVKGIKDIKRVIVSRELTEHPKAMEDGTEWVLYTEGSNLAAVLSIPGVDPTRIKTNNIPEIQTTLGIEAARQAVIDEAIGVLKEQGLDVDIRHILLVADIMTQTGELRQIGRHGISGHKQSVLSRASFEVTVKYLLEAAAQGQVDPLVGVTENVIIGQPIPLGTGIVELLMNPGLRQEFEDVDEEWIAKMEEELSE